MFKYIKNIFSKIFRWSLVIVNKQMIINNLNDFDNILQFRFNDKKTLNYITKDIINLIVNNNFIVTPSKILIYFKYNYNLTSNELLVLSFKLGMISRAYIENPISLLKDALKYPDLFTKEEINTLNVLKDKQKQYADEQIKQQYIVLENESLEKEKENKLKANDPDSLIDDWLHKHKKI